ncbi:MAG: putative beta-lysine N-acetyltransferase [Limnochordia bacterium]
MKPALPPIGEDWPQPLGQQEETITRDSFTGRILIDPYNSIVRLLEYRGQELIRLADALTQKARERGLTKVLATAREDDWESFIARGFVLEGILKGYFQGQDAYLLARFLTADRRFSPIIEEEDALIEQILAEPTGVEMAPLPLGYTGRRASAADAPLLAKLFDRVFETYPTPVNDPQYLAWEMSEDTIYYLIEHEGKAVSAAGAYLDRKSKGAEITECATHPRHRGKGFMSTLISALEKELGDYQTIYGLARSQSFGMNLLFRRFGYRYRGRLINQCNISGNFQDLNLWVR